MRGRSQGRDVGDPELPRPPRRSGNENVNAGPEVPSLEQTASILLGNANR